MMAAFMKAVPVVSLILTAKPNSIPVVSHNAMGILVYHVPVYSTIWEFWKFHIKPYLSHECKASCSSKPLSVVHL